MTTVNDIMNIGRAINAGEITFYTDGTLGVCKNEVCLIGVRVGERCYGTATVGFSVNPSESEEGMRATFKGLQACFFGLFQKLQVCTDIKCQFCRNIVDILNGEEMIRYKNSSKWEDKELPEAKQMSDEGARHKSYVTKDRPGLMLLKCYQHCGSELCI